ncbi:hypothetical protein VNO78_24649 [Psophocarpus tetragonolobus]|uniref:Uncharacterized protein n=1 Tax=Psophocarpus tetragonolobus TaxID=3891 RepID=A0AAN9S5Y7_PSOTE
MPVSISSGFVVWFVVKIQQGYLLFQIIIFGRLDTCLDVNVRSVFLKACRLGYYLYMLFKLYVSFGVLTSYVSTLIGLENFYLPDVVMAVDIWGSWNRWCICWNFGSY